MVWAVIILLIMLECLTLFTLGGKVDRMERVIRSHDDHLAALNEVNRIQSRHLDAIRVRLDAAPVSQNGAVRPMPMRGKRISRER
jgi:hypothetical protein